MKGVMGRINLVWPSAWLKDHHRFYFKLLHKPLKERKFRGERFSLSCWVSFEGEDLPCFSVTQGKALLYSAWDSPCLELPKTCTDFIPILHSPFLPSVCPGGLCSQKLCRQMGVLCPNLLRGCERQKYFVFHLRYHHPTNPSKNLRCSQVDSFYQS